MRSVLTHLSYFHDSLDRLPTQDLRILWLIKFGDCPPPAIGRLLLLDALTKVCRDEGIITEYLSRDEGATPEELKAALGLSSQDIEKTLKKLCGNGLEFEQILDGVGLVRYRWRRPK